MLAWSHYDPWGQNQRGTPGTFGFTGELQQGNNVYLRARWYNAAAGTLFGRDPYQGNAEEPQSQHYFAYTHNEPIGSTDPTGRWRWRRTGSPEHAIIEDEFMGSGTPSSHHAEFDDARLPAAPGYPLVIVDILRSDTGDVWEIEPITKKSAAVPEATAKALVLNLYGRHARLIRGVPSLDGYYRGLAPRVPWATAKRTGAALGLPSYNWNHVDWRLGLQLNFIPIRIPGYISVPPIRADLVAAATAPGEVLFWYESDQFGQAALAALAAYLGNKAGQARERGKGPIGVPGIGIPVAPLMPFEPPQQLPVCTVA
jgi:RHS repeat-associated protein